MKPINCLIFGASGQIGRNLIRKLTKNNYKVTVVTRNLHQKGYILKTQASAGWIECIEANIFNEKKLRELVSHADVCINMIGILYEAMRIMLKGGKYYSRKKKSNDTISYEGYF